jgi:hypothetical protein
VPACLRHACLLAHAPAANVCRTNWPTRAPAHPPLPPETRLPPRLQAGAAGTARWCIPFEADAALVQTCTDAVSTGNTANVSFVCVAGGSAEACEQMISMNTADLMVLGGACSTLH